MRPLALVLALHSAEPPPVDVTWHGDETCPATHFHARLAAYLDGASQQRPVRVVITVQQGKQWTADLALTSDGGRTDRHLTGNACNEIADAAAFVTAVAVDPGVLARPHPDEPPDPLPEPTPDLVAVPPPAVVPEPPPPDPPVPEPAPIEPAEPQPAPRRPRIGGFVRASGGFEAFALPRIAPTVNLAVGLLGERWRVEFGGTYRAPTTEYRTDYPAVGARVRLWTVAARGCAVLRPSVLEIPLCGGLEAGQALAHGVGYDAAGPGRHPWLAAVVGPALVWSPRRSFALWLGVEFGVPLIAGNFTSEGLGELYAIKRYSLRAGLGVEVRFF